MTSGADSVFVAISDPTRRAILDRLTHGPTRVTDVAAPFAMSLNAVSKHVKVLERAGLVRRARQGREHVLELDPGPRRAVGEGCWSLERYWNDRLDRREAFFAKEREKKGTRSR